MPAQKPGKLVLPPAELHTSNGVFRSQPVTLTVKAGHVPAPQGTSRPRQDPFGMSPFPEDDDDPFDAFRRRQQAAGDTDLFLRGELDKKEVYQGEQATLSLWIYARVDLSRVDAVTMPKLDGFWTEDVETPKELTGETRVGGRRAVPRLPAPAPGAVPGEVRPAGDRLGGGGHHHRLPLRRPSRAPGVAAASP